MAAMSADIVPPSELSEDDIGVWDRLCSNTPELSVAFLSYPYALAAEHAFPNVRVCRVRREGRPVAFFSFQYKSIMHRWLGIGERLAGELSDFFGIVGETDVSIGPRTLVHMCGLRALLFTHLGEGQIALGLSGETPEPGHLIDFPDGGSAFWQDKRIIDKKSPSGAREIWCGIVVP